MFKTFLVSAVLVRHNLRVLGSQLNLELRVGARLFRQGRGLTAGKNCWLSREWSVIWSALFFRPGLCRRCRSSCRATWTRTCTWDDGNRVRISGALGELAKDKSPSHGQQGAQAIDNHSQGQEVAVVEEFVYLGFTQQLKALLISHVTS